MRGGQGHWKRADWDSRSEGGKFKRKGGKHGGKHGGGRDHEPKAAESAHHAANHVVVPLPGVQGLGQEARRVPTLHANSHERRLRDEEILRSVPPAVAAVLDDALVRVLESANPLRSRYVMEGCLASLEDELTRFVGMSGVNVGDQGPLIVPFGSSGLGVAEPYADIDLLVGVAHGDSHVPVLSASQFFSGFSSHLETRATVLDVRRINVVQGRIPLVSFIMQGLKFEVLFAVFPCRRFPPYFRQSPLHIIDRTAQLIHDGRISVLSPGMDMMSPAAIDPLLSMDRASAFGVSAAAACSEFLKSSCDLDTFRLCLRTLRHWARSRNVYSSKLGYFNGITLASMVHYVMTTLRRQHDEAQSAALSELTSSSQQSVAATHGSVGSSPILVPEHLPQPSPASVAPGILPTPERCLNGPLFPDPPDTAPTVGHPMMVMMPGMSQPFLLVPMNALNPTAPSSAPTSVAPAASVDEAARDDGTPPPEGQKSGKSTRRHKKKPPAKPTEPVVVPPDPAMTSSQMLPQYPPHMQMWPGFPPVDAWPPQVFNPFFGGFPHMPQPPQPLSQLSSLSSLGTYARTQPGLRMSPSIVLAHLFHIFAEWWWRDTALSTVNSAPSDPGGGVKYHAAAMRVYPPFGLPNENATRNVNISTLQAIRHEILQSRRCFLDSLAEYKICAVVDLPPLAERFWDDMFASADFFRRSVPVMFIMIDVRHLDADGPSDIDYDHGVAPDTLDEFVADAQTLPRDDGDEIEDVTADGLMKTSLVSFDLLGSDDRDAPVAPSEIGCHDDNDDASRINIAGQDDDVRSRSHSLALSQLEEEGEREDSRRSHGLSTGLTATQEGDNGTEMSVGDADDVACRTDAHLSVSAYSGAFGDGMYGDPGSVRSHASKSPPSSPRSTVSSIHTSVSRVGTTVSMPLMRTRMPFGKVRADPPSHSSPLTSQDGDEGRIGTTSGSVENDSHHPSSGVARDHAVTVLASEPMRLYPPNTSNPSLLRSWRADVFEAWTMLVERHLLGFAQDIERKLLPARDKLLRRGVLHRQNAMISVVPFDHMLRVTSTGEPGCCFILKLTGIPEELLTHISVAGEDDACCVPDGYIINTEDYHFGSDAGSTRGRSSGFTVPAAIRRFPAPSHPVKQLIAASLHSDVVQAIHSSFDILEYSQLRWWREMARNAGAGTMAFQLHMCNRESVSAEVRAAATASRAYIIHGKLAEPRREFEGMKDGTTVSRDTRSTGRDSGPRKPVIPISDHPPPRHHHPPHPHQSHQPPPQQQQSQQQHRHFHPHRSQGGRHSARRSPVVPAQQPMPAQPPHYPRPTFDPPPRPLPQQFSPHHPSHVYYEQQRQFSAAYPVQPYTPASPVSMVPHPGHAGMFIRPSVTSPMPPAASGSLRSHSDAQYQFMPPPSLLYQDPDAYTERRSGREPYHVTFEDKSMPDPPVYPRPLHMGGERGGFVDVSRAVAYPPHPHYTSAPTQTRR